VLKEKKISEGSTLYNFLFMNLKSQSYSKGNISECQGLGWEGSDFQEARESVMVHEVSCL
jgi:hypothetical protein